MFRILVFAILFVLSFIDALYLLVPDAGIVMLLGAIIIYIPAEEIAGRIPVAAAFLGIYCFAALICNRFGKAVPFGFGDIKLICALSLILPAADLIRILALASIYSGAFSAILIVFRKAGAKSEIPFVPFIAAGYTAFAAISTG